MNECGAVLNDGVFTRAARRYGGLLAVQRAAVCRYEDLLGARRGVARRVFVLANSLYKWWLFRVIRPINGNARLPSH